MISILSNPILNFAKKKKKKKERSIQHQKKKNRNNINNPLVFTHSKQYSV